MFNKSFTIFCFILKFNCSPGLIEYLLETLVLFSFGFIFSFNFASKNLSGLFSEIKVFDIDFLNLKELFDIFQLI